MEKIKNKALICWATYNKNINKKSSSKMVN
jgi:hypothetical protein